MSLQTGVVDSTEHTATQGATNFYEVVDNYSVINWQWTWGGPAIINQEVWDSLPDDLKVKVEEAFWEASNIYDRDWAEYEGKAMDLMTDLGMTVTELTPAQMQEWIDYSRSIDDELMDMVGEAFWSQFMAIVDDYRASR